MGKQQRLIQLAEQSTGWVYINVWGTYRVYHNGQFVRERECALSASLQGEDCRELHLPKD